MTEYEGLDDKDEFDEKKMWEEFLNRPGVAEDMLYRAMHDHVLYGGFSKIKIPIRLSYNPQHLLKGPPPGQK